MEELAKITAAIFNFWAELRQREIYVEIIFISTVLYALARTYSKLSAAKSQWIPFIISFISEIGYTKIHDYQEMIRFIVMSTMHGGLAIASYSYLVKRKWMIKLMSNHLRKER